MPQSVAEADEWLRHDQLMRHDQVLAKSSLTVADWENMAASASS